MSLLQEIWAARYADYLRRKFLMRGGLRIQLPGDIQPVVDVDHLEQGDRFLNSEHLFNVGAAVGAVAAAFGRVQLAVVAGSNVMVELDSIVMGLAGPSSAQIRHDSVALVGVNPIVDSDSRMAGFAALTPSGVEIRTDTNGAHSAGLQETDINFTGSIVLPYEGVLTPGHNLTVESDIVNVAFTVHFKGRYRTILPGEV